MRSETVELLEKLVAFRTVSKDSNLDLIAFVERFLGDFGVESQRVLSPCGTKTSLIANVGPRVPGGTVLSGHTDVVPVEGQDWTSDPWQLTERENKLFGRGTCDMKGFLAIALSRVPDMLRMGLRRPIQLAFSHDEEVGCAGADALVSAMRTLLPPASVVIVGEPTLMKVVSAHKGMLGFRTTVHGYEAHSSLVNKGVSAVMRAAELVAWHESQNEKNALVASGRSEPSQFDVPFTTLHVGTITGGTAINITAGRCEFVSDIRTMPGEDRLWQGEYFGKVAQASRQMQRVRPEARIDGVQFIDVPSYGGESNSAAVSLAKQLTGDDYECAVSYATEAGFFQKYGYSAVVCGPGSITDAHQPNEFIAISEMERGEEFIDDLLEQLTE